MNPPDDAALRAATARCAEALRRAGLRLVTAESCTGGWIAKCLTDLPGSSAWFTGGLVTYTNGAKTALLAVPAGLIEAHGAVSEPVAAAMAGGALARTGADLAVAVTGIAGPGGGSPGKPVGTVWFAWAGGVGGPRTERRRFAGDRDAIRRLTVQHALDGVRRVLG